jgi:hypothetical protein
MLLNVILLNANALVYIKVYQSNFSCCSLFLAYSFWKTLFITRATVPIKPAFCPRFEVII